MAKTKDYFYAGVVLADNRESILLFDGVWMAPDGDPASQTVQSIKDFESNKHGGVKVALTAFNEL